MVCKVKTSVFVLLMMVISFAPLKAQVLSGEVYIRDNTELYLNQIYVTNLTTHKTVLSDYYGNFSIPAAKGDVMRFTSIISNRKDVRVTDEMLSHQNNRIELSVAYYEIQEVIINRFRPTGNLRRDVAVLKSSDKANEIKKVIGLPEPTGNGLPPQLPVASFADGGLNFSVDAIFEILSGERKKKERLIAYERMEYSIKSIRDYFGKPYFAKHKIPEHLIDNFLQFVYTSNNLYSFVESGNFEGTQIYIERYVPVYQKRLQNSSLIDVIN